MSEDTAKIRLKIGQIEIEYEGRESFLQDDLINLMKKTLEFYSENRDSILPEPVQSAQPPPGAGVQGNSLDHSTNTIAAHLGGSSGSDLAMAAAAHLALVKGQGKFSRKEILAEMREATTYYNANMSSNLSKSLDTLVKGKRLNQVSKGTYSLSAQEKSSVEAKLAQHQ